MQDVQISTGHHFNIHKNGWFKLGWLKVKRKYRKPSNPKHVSIRRQRKAQDN